MAWLPRLHLVEIEDLRWCPRIIRDFATDYLQWIQSRLGLHKPMVHIVGNALDETGATHIVDLCAGGGGPMLDIIQDLNAEGRSVTATLTDLYPNQPAASHFARSHPACTYYPNPVNARNVPKELIGLRTVCNAFHHFAPQSASAILQDSVNQGQPIVVLEIPERRLLVVLQTLFAPVMVMLATPLIRPVSWTRLLFTYLLPAVPMICLWDGVVSQLRAYTAEELEALGRSAAPEYVWKSGTLPHEKAPLNVTYLVGIRPGEEKP